MVETALMEKVLSLWQLESAVRNCSVSSRPWLTKWGSKIVARIGAVNLIASLRRGVAVAVEVVTNALNKRLGCVLLMN